MWTEEKLKEAAKKWSDEHFCGAIIPVQFRTEAFLAGCKYIINNIQKEK